MPPRARVLYDLRYASPHFPGIGSHAVALLEGLLSLERGFDLDVIIQPGQLEQAPDLADRFTQGRIGHRLEAGHPLHWHTAAETGAIIRESGTQLYLSPFWLMPDSPGIPVALWLHDVLPLTRWGTTTWWRQRLFAWSMRRATRAQAIFTSSQASRHAILRHTSLAPSRLHVVPLGLSAIDSGPSVRPSNAPNDAYALVVGINKPHKNLRVLAQAWMLMGKEPPLDLVSAGPIDSRYPDLRSLTPDHDAVHVLGRVPNGALEWLYRNAAMLVFPTRHEGFGFPLLEAAARGVPVLASDIPVLREIGEGVARFLPPEEPKAWAAAVQELWRDPGERERMRTAGPPRAAQYSSRRCAETVAEHLHQLLEAAR